MGGIHSFFSFGLTKIGSHRSPVIGRQLGQSPMVWRAFGGSGYLLALDSQEFMSGIQCLCRAVQQGALAVAVVVVYVERK